MKNKLSVAVIAALCITSASAMQFQTLGYKSVAMGGAGVASSSGSVATYNNPALLAKPEYDMEISAGGGVAYQDFGAGAAIQNLDDSGFLETMSAVSNDPTLLATDPAAVQSLLDGKNAILGMDGKGVGLAPQGYFAMQMSNFGVGVFISSDMLVTAHVDQAYNKLIFDTGSAYVELLDNGTTNLLAYGGANDLYYQTSSIEYGVNNGKIYSDLKGLALVEVPLAYGHNFDIGIGNLMVGGAYKIMSGTTIKEQSNIDNSGSSNTQEATTTTFGIDLGVAYEPSFINDLTLAMVAKNLNAPTFDFADGSSVSVDPMIRIGAAYSLFESLEFAADMDITKNETFYPGFSSQMMGGGVNYHPASWFALRAGLMKNIDSADEAGVIYTAGVGFGLKWLQLDLSAQMSSAETTVGDTTYPQYMKVNLAIVSRW